MIMTVVDALPPRLRLTLLISLLAILLLVQALLLYHWRLELAQTLIPYLQLLVELCEQRFDVAEFQVLHGGNEQLFSLRLTADHPLPVHGRVLPGMDVSATTLVTHLLLDLWIYGAVLIIGIALQPLRAVRLLPAAMAGLGLLLWLDIPLVLLGSIEGLLLQHLAPDRLDTDPWVLWQQFLTQGGRMVLALGLGLLVLGVGRKR